jgi:hypothetical protein
MYLLLREIAENWSKRIGGSKNAADSGPGALQALLKAKQQSQLLTREVI